MANKKNSGAKLPVDAKESFLKSVEKKSKKTDEKSVSVEATDVENKESASVLFDKEEIKEPGRDKEKKKEKVLNTKSAKEKKADGNQNKEKKQFKDKPKVIYPKLPFINIIPIIMAFQSLFLIVIPFLSTNGAATYFIVTLFWLTLLLSGGLMLFVKLKYKDAINSLYSEMSEAEKIYRFVSVINFFRNKTAKIADIAFFAVTVLMIVVIILGTKNVFDNIALTAIVMSLFMLSLNMHVYFNDSIYEYSIKFNKFIQEKDVIANE